MLYASDDDVADRVVNYCATVWGAPDCHGRDRAHNEPQRASVTDLHVRASSDEERDPDDARNRSATPRAETG